MFLSAPTLDDLLRAVLEKLLKSRLRITPTKGAALDLPGVLLQLTNPRARLSVTERRSVLFGAIGELLWYLSKTNDLRFITYYLPEYKESSDDGRSVHGGYGPRFFKMDGRHNQIAQIITLLRKNPDSRRAAIQLFTAADINAPKKDVPCTCTMQFLIRRKRLHMVTFMRSNDAYRGLPHDLFAFTMLQELVARSVECELGVYKHAVGSLHLYEDDMEKARQYLAEGWQGTTTVMPPMPFGDPWAAVDVLRAAERKIRNGRSVTAKDLPVDVYWKDIIRLLLIFKQFRNDRIPRGKRVREIGRLKKQMKTRVFDAFIEQKKARTGKPRPSKGEQLALRFARPATPERERAGRPRR